VKGVVGGAASSASKITDALDKTVRGAGGMDAEAPSGMDAAKVCKCTQETFELLCYVEAKQEGCGRLSVL